MDGLIAPPRASGLRPSEAAPSIPHTHNTHPIEQVTRHLALCLRAALGGEGHISVGLAIARQGTSLRCVM